MTPHHRLGKGAASDTLEKTQPHEQGTLSMDGKDAGSWARM